MPQVKVQTALSVLIKMQEHNRKGLIQRSNLVASLDLQRVLY